MSAVDRVCSIIETRAECVERHARYEHELVYTRGLRDAAAAAREHTSISNSWSAVYAMWRDTGDDGDWRAGCNRALRIIEGEQDTEVNWMLFERIEKSIQELRAEVWGLAAQNIDIRKSGLEK